MSGNVSRLLWQKVRKLCLANDNTVAAEHSDFPPQKSQIPTVFFSPVNKIHRTATFRIVSLYPAATVVVRPIFPLSGRRITISLID